MRIPSYDDLTASIPDISPGEMLGSVSALLPEAGLVVPRVTAASAPTHQLFAALHAAGGRPDADFVASAFRRKAAAGARLPPKGGSRDVELLIAIACDFSPRIQQHAGGTVVLDIAGLQRLLGDAATIADHLSKAGAPRVAVATSQTAAILLARAHDGVTVATGDPGAALTDVPLAVLERLQSDRDEAAMSGVGTSAHRTLTAAHERSFDVLWRWGLTTLGEFAALPAADLSARLGPDGVALQRLARGIDPQPMVPDPGVTRFIGSFELEWPIDMLEPLSFVFARMLDPLATALERADRGAVALHLELRLTDRTSHARTLPLPVAMRDPRVLRTLLLLDLESHPPSAAVDKVFLEIDPAPSRIVQYSLLERAVPSPETLATLMARLGALIGDSRCGSPALLDTHQPDAFAVQPPAFGDLGKKGTGARGLAADERPDCPRFTLRRFRPVVAIRVAVEAGRPVRIAIDRRGMPGGSVQRSAGPWRSSGGWWDRVHWNRDEWDVALSDGTVCRVFRDRGSGQWFMDGMFD
jgi:protein ImuB